MPGRIALSSGKWKCANCLASPSMAYASRGYPGPPSPSKTLRPRSQTSSNCENVQKAGKCSRLNVLLEPTLPGRRSRAFSDASNGHYTLFGTHAFLLYVKIMPLLQ
ncbi:hypothetical protein AB205_0156510 [Aquarana catesbeiana]|uniref:Uncharacterized protein n=1 Tax=Aquarana catesbeiana TaxID=8400 RepID=A0A2G9RKU3_AQUCT|nr:hypothetical protein AB205_0156510 [Aquarana catesbeiana]